MKYAKHVLKLLDILIKKSKYKQEICELKGEINGYI